MAENIEDMWQELTDHFGVHRSTISQVRRKSKRVNPVHEEPESADLALARILRTEEDAE